MRACTRGGDQRGLEKSDVTSYTIELRLPPLAQSHSIKQAKIRCVLHIPRKWCMHPDLIRAADDHWFVAPARDKVYTPFSSFTHDMPSEMRIIVSQEETHWKFPRFLFANNFIHKMIYESHRSTTFSSVVPGG